MKHVNGKRIGLILLSLGFLSSPFAASVYAATASANTTISSAIAAVISITTSGTVNVNVTPTVSGASTIASDTVTVTTNNSTGYVLTFSDADTNTNLVSGSNNIAAHAGTFATPTTMSTANRWGYRMDSAGSFGAGPTGAVSNQASAGSLTWAGVPSSASPHTLKTTATHNTSGDANTIWYHVRADATQPTGTYTDVVTYTATTN